jgi:hypothetical protein
MQKHIAANKGPDPTRSRRGILQSSLDILPSVRASSKRVELSPLAASAPSSRPSVVSTPALRELVQAREAAASGASATATTYTTVTATHALARTTTTTTTTTMVITTTTGASSSPIVNTVAGRSITGLTPTFDGVSVDLWHSRQRSLLDEILLGEEQGVVQQMQSGARIFSSFNLQQRAMISEYCDGPVSCMFEFALERDEYACARAMLCHCVGADKVERNARLWDMLEKALSAHHWPTVETLLNLFSDLHLGLRAKNFHSMYRYLLARARPGLAYHMLGLGVAFVPDPARATSCQLTDRQLTRIVLDTFKCGNRDLFMLLQKKYPGVLNLAVWSSSRVCAYANGTILSAWLDANLELQELSRGKVDVVLFGSILRRLVTAGHQSTAVELLERHRHLKPPCGTLLRAAVQSGAMHFMERLLATDIGSDPALQGDLYRALCKAIKVNCRDAVILLKKYGVNLNQQPKEAFKLLTQLIDKNLSNPLALLIQTGQMQQDTIFLQLIRHRKLAILEQLQPRFVLSICEQVKVELHMPQAEIGCAANLASLMKQLHSAAQRDSDQQDWMILALVQSGFSYPGALKLASLWDCLAESGLTLLENFEQPLLLAMAAALAGLTDRTEVLWSDLGQDAESQTELSERDALQVLGSETLFHARDLLHKEVIEALALAPSAWADLGERLRKGLGLPATLADVVAQAGRQALQTHDQSSQQGSGSLRAALAQAILARLQQHPAPVLNPQDPVSIWHCACREMLVAVATNMAWQAGQQ